MATHKLMGQVSTPEPSPKRRKITPEEKEQMRKEKEDLRLKREEEKRVKEEEREVVRKKKEEEKRVKEEEKRVKEEEKKLKEEEKKRVAEEKQKALEEKEAELKKKEQEQTRILSFFNKKKKKGKKAVAAATKCDFDTDFLEFHVKEGVSMPTVETEVNEEDPVDWLSSLNIDHVTTEEEHVTAKALVSHVQTAATLGLNPDSYNNVPCTTLLSQLPRRYLQFYGDERPAYLGTYSKTLSSDLLQTPLLQLPGLDYEYDSEADWEDEGEDVEDSEMSDEEMEDDEMEDFVCSDDGTPKVARVATAQEPVVVWGCTDQVGMGFGGLIGTGPIDPFKDYWTTEKVCLVTTPKVVPKTPNPVVSSSTGPSLNPFAVLSQTMSASASVAAVTKEFLNAAKPEKTIGGEDLTVFLKRVDGSDDNKALLTELLVKDWPQYTRKMVTATLKHYAERKGQGNNKKWVVKNV